MKNLVLTTIFCLGFLLVNAQKVIEKNIPHNDREIEMEVPFASDIEVKTWDKGTVYFKATISTKDSKYLDLYQLDIKEGSGYINIESDTEAIFEAFYDEWNKDNPRKKRYYHTGDQYEFNYVLYVPKNASFKVTSINGSMTSEIIEGDFEADLINGDIEIKKYAGNLKLNTINGEIDLKIGNSRFVAETIHGDIYADEKLKVKSYDQHVGQKVESVASNSDNRLKLNTINGNMYLRL